MPPEATLERVLPLRRVMGITRLADLTGLDTVGIPVVAAYRPNSRSLALSQGKGLTRAAAQASAVMEAIELWHAERIAAPLRLASYAELSAAERCVDVWRLPKLSVSAFHEDLRLLWIEGHDLLADEPTWVPYETVHTDFTLPLPSGSGAFVLSSNGLASGNHPTEALSHALCEVIERDATSLWQAAGGTRQIATSLDLAAVEDAACRLLLERFAEGGLEVAVWDATSDVAIATCVCHIVDRRPSPSRSMYANSGKGAHPVAEIALLRALTEAAQSRVTYISGARDDQDHVEYEAILAADEVERCRRRIRRGMAGRRRLSEFPSRLHERFEEDLAFELQRLQAVGVEQVVAVDLSHPAIGVPVVRVVVPGLETSCEFPGYVPGPRALAAAARRPR